MQENGLVDNLSELVEASLACILGKEFWEAFSLKINRVETPLELVHLDSR